MKRSKAWNKLRREQKHKEIAETIMKKDVVESPEPEEREEDDHDEAAEDSEGSMSPTTPPRTCPSPTAALSPMPEMPSACGL